MGLAVPQPASRPCEREVSSTGSLLALVAVAVGVGARLGRADGPLDYDSANYAYVATRMLADGSSPFAFFNNKPPGIYYWYQLCFAVFGDGPVTCHLTSIIPDLVVIFALARVGRVLAGERVGDLAAALFATLAPALRLSSLGYTESPVVALALTGAVVLGPRDDSARASARAFLAGLALGAATLFKQPAFLLAGSFLVWIASRSAPGRRVRASLCFAAGLGLIQLGLLAWLARAGQLDIYVERVFVQGLSRGYRDGFHAAERLREWIRVVVLPTPVILPAALAGLTSRGELRTRGLAIALIVPILSMTLVSYELYDHYLIPALPALCLVVAEWLTIRPPSCFTKLVWRVGAVVQALSLVVLLTDRPPRGSAWESLLAGWRDRPLELEDQLRIADFVRASTLPSEPILSTGSEIPYLAHRRNGYRFLGIAPYLGRLDAVGFSDFPAAADRVHILVLERWRLRLLPEAWVSTLDDGRGPWCEVSELTHPEWLVYERCDRRQPSAILDFPRGGP